MKYVVDRGIIWFVPFVNIDSIEMDNRNGVSMHVKNMNKYPDNNNLVDC